MTRENKFSTSYLNFSCLCCNNCIEEIICLPKLNIMEIVKNQPNMVSLNGELIRLERKTYRSGFSCYLSFRIEKIVTSHSKCTLLGKGRRWGWQKKKCHSLKFFLCPFSLNLNFCCFVLWDSDNIIVNKNNINNNITTFKQL